MVKKNYDDTLSRFNLIPERNGRTNRRTDLLYQYLASVCWRATKTNNLISELSLILHIPFRHFDVKFLIRNLLRMVFL